jgi:hypothetical protein
LKQQVLFASAKIKPCRLVRLSLMFRMCLGSSAG